MRDEGSAAERPAIWGIALAALGYFLTQEASFDFPDADKFIMAIWPAAGVGLAAFILTPRRRWPLLAAAIFVVGNLANILEGRSLLVSLGFMAVDLLESWLSAVLVLRIGGRPPLFDRLAEVGAIVVVAGGLNGLTALAAAAIGSVTNGAAFGSSWFSWWVSDGLGMLIVAPLILTLAPRSRILSKPRLFPSIEYAVFLALWSLFAFSTFDTVSAGGFPHTHPYVLILLILWPAYRHSARGIGIASFVLAIIAVTSRAVSVGPSPFPGTGLFGRLLDVELFVAIVTIAAYTFSAAFAELRDERKVAENSLEEQRLAERDRKKKEDRYRTILEGAADGIFVSRRDGAFVESNAAGRRILGYEEREIREMTLADIMDPSELGVMAEEDSALENLEALFGGRSLVRRDGSKIDVEISAKMLPSGEVVSIVRDVTAHRFDGRRTELRLRLMESDTSTNLDDLLHDILAEAETATASLRGCLCLLAEDERNVELIVRSTGAAEAPPRGTAAGVPQVCGEAIGERRSVVARGSPDPRAVAVPVFIKGKLVAVLCFEGKTSPYDETDIERLSRLGELSWDVLDRKRTMGLLVETEERFTLVFRNSPMPTSITRADSGFFVDANEAFLALFGYSGEELIGRTWVDLDMYEDPRERERLGELVDGKVRTLSWELRLRKKGGSVIDAKASVELVFIRGAAYFVAQIEDITERKTAMAEISRALEEKEILLRELYHRANNNMQVISALLDFQAVSLGDERLSKAIEETQNRIGALALVNRKLFEARDLSYVDLRDYIEDLLGILAQSYSSKNCRMIVKKELEEVKVLVDTAIPCGLILNELISNVYLHAYPEAPVGLIEIGLRQAPDGRISIRVADHGIGLPPGFDIQRDGRIGLQNIVGLCSSQLKGTVDFDRLNGFACEVTFTDNLYNARV